MTKHISLTQAYAITFLLLAMWALFAYMTMYNQISAQKKYAQLINVSGKQRMLSQRTALLANHYLQTKDPSFLTELDEYYQDMRADHLFLIKHIPSPAVDSIYHSVPFRLEEKNRSYFELLDKFRSQPDLFSTTQIYLQTSQLLPLLDHAVNVYEQESDQKTARLMRLEGYILAGTLLTLILEALYIVRPALRRANWNMDRLRRMVNKQTERLTVYEQIFANSNDGIVITDSDNRILEVNPSFSRISGFSPEEVLGQTPAILKSTHQEAGFYKKFWEALYAQGHWSGEFINRKKDGSIYYQLTYAFVLRDSAQRIKYHVGITSDVSEMKEDKNRLEYLALYDMLTDLPNRSYLVNQVRKAMERSKRFHHKLAVILLDLDNFKSINDTLTHRIGDMVLKRVGGALAECTRSTDTVARVGGDEFVMLVEEIENENSLITIMEKIQEFLSKPMQIEEYQIAVTCSMGVAIYPDDAVSYDNLLQYADTAMYHAKNSGKNQFSFFTGELNAAVQEKIKIENALKSAIADDEFSLVFQPMVRLADERIAGFEVLLRWSCNDLGWVSPDVFIPVAEALGQIRMIDNWVLQQVRDILIVNSFNGLHFSVNISAKRFSHKDFLAEVTEIFRGTGVQDRIVLELTETAIIEDIEHTGRVLAALKEQGFKIAIDDFGTGYSSFYHLKYLPIDALKIDKSFVMDMEQDANARVIVDSIISMAGKMDLYVVAEGIETAAQLAYLRLRKKCTYGQGFFLSVPLSLEQAQQRLRQEN